jgi:hypothetical protein
MASIARSSMRQSFAIEKSKETIEMVMLYVVRLSWINHRKRTDGLGAAEES